MRVLITVMTNKQERLYAFDFFCHWPFLTFENLTKLNIGE